MGFFMGWTMDEPAVISLDEHGDLYIAPIYLQGGAP